MFISYTVCEAFIPGFCVCYQVQLFQSPFELVRWWKWNHSQPWISVLNIMFISHSHHNLLWPWWLFTIQQRAQDSLEILLSSTYDPKSLGNGRRLMEEVFPKPEIEIASITHSLLMRTQSQFSLGATKQSMHPVNTVSIQSNSRNS